MKCQECEQETRKIVRIPEPDGEWILCPACFDGVADLVDLLLYVTPPASGAGQILNQPGCASTNGSSSGYAPDAITA